MKPAGIASERGSVLVAGLLLALALLLLIGAAVDVGRAFSARRALASLADQAVLSASQEIDLAARHRGELALDPARARAAAVAAAGEPGVSVSASADRRFVHVSVRRRLPTVLLRLAGVTSLDIAATATATPREP